MHCLFFIVPTIFSLFLIEGKNKKSHIPHKNDHLKNKNNYTWIRRIIKRSFMSSHNFFYVPERPLVILDFDIMDTLSIEFYTTVPSSTTFFTVKVESYGLRGKVVTETHIDRTLISGKKTNVVLSLFIKTKEGAFYFSCEKCEK